jgi:hypothetical protein
MKWEALSAAQDSGPVVPRGLRRGPAIGGERMQPRALQPTASAAHGPKLHSHGPLTSFRCRFVCGITSQKKSYLWGEAGAVVSTCMRDHVPEEVVPDVPSRLWIGWLGAAPVGRDGRCGERFHAGQDVRGSQPSSRGRSHQIETQSRMRCCSSSPSSAGSVAYLRKINQG